MRPENISTKMKNNMTEYEEQLLINAVSELKMNFLEEKNKPDTPSEDMSTEMKKTPSEDKSGEEE